MNFAFSSSRIVPNGVVEPQPLNIAGEIVQRLPSGTVRSAEHYDSLLLLASGSDMEYEFGVWDDMGRWVVAARGKLSDDVPAVIPFPFVSERGLYVYCRAVVALAGDATLSMKQVIGRAAGDGADLDAILVALTTLAAKQDAIIAGLTAPAVHTVIVADDATDVTDIANVGLCIGGAGDLVYSTAGDPLTVVTLAVIDGQFIYGQFARVMAATTATGIVGVAR